AAIGHISPEAAEGGLIALVEEEDIIEIDIPGKRLTLKVDQETINKRRAAWTPSSPKIKEGYVYRYSKLVSSASSGAIFKED
ncbi:MAG: dihydroxy-acid dehydratase, partial [Pseudomonadota bacterium]